MISFAFESECASMRVMEKIRLGISSCLLGNNVRWNGGHAMDRFLVNSLGKYVEYVPVCPEVECGFGIPRDTFRLVGDPKRPRLVIHKTGADHTERMEAWARKRVEELEKEELCGYIFKSDSPSSGMERVKVYSDKGIPSKVGVGIFARIFMEHFPLTPVEEEGRLHDPVLRENFIERIFTCMRYCDIMEGTRQVGRLVDFQTKNKLLLMAHSPKHLKEMGSLVAHAKGMPARELVERYESLLMEAMALKPTVAKHENVLMHIMGYFKKDLSADEKQELLGVINDYKRGLIPLIVPVTLLSHYVRKYRQPYLKEQTYLNPHPMELMLRNHV
jgi:uncharacterized protein YbgA (DUF1722 family)/uncharacterized protein YbbK (DUF523 family)